jgi:hypothetical protein
MDAPGAFHTRQLPCRRPENAYGRAIAFKLEIAFGFP